MINADKLQAGAAKKEHMIYRLIERLTAITRNGKVNLKIQFN